MASRHPQALSRKIRRSFEARARKGIARCRLAERRGPVLVGFSGGADSTALLVALSSLLPPSARLIALHVDHGLRGERSARDADHAEAFAQARGIPFRRIRAEVGRKAARGLEAAAREARRAAFLRAAGEEGAEAVALAHTRDDQAETVLMRLFEGSGLRGLVGMRPEAPLEEGGGVFLLRPFLEIARSEARAYLRALGVEWVEDETNADEGRARNALRLRLWPAIEEVMGEAAASGVAASAEHLAAALEALEGGIRDAAEAYLAEEEGRVRIAPLPRAARLPRAVRAGLWREALGRARGRAPGRAGRRPLGRIIEALDRLALEGGPSARMDLPGGLEARRSYGALELGRFPDASRPAPGEAILALPGRARLAGLEVWAEEAAPEAAAGGADGKSAAVVDAGRIAGRLVVRTRREGDRFQPPGARSERKLKDFFIARKLPRAERDAIPLVADGPSVVWIPGYAQSEKYRAGPFSPRRFLMRASPAAEKDPKVR